MKKMCIISMLLLFLSINNLVFCQNPLIRDQFTADPTARVFEGKICVYPSHDINCGTSWFCMKDYHVFSSENLIDWTDHGMIVTQEKVAWVQYNTIDFGKTSPSFVIVKAQSNQEAPVVLQSGKMQVKIEIPQTDGWQLIKAELQNAPIGIQNIKLNLASSQSVEVDWIRFE